MKGNDLLFGPLSFEVLCYAAIREKARPSAVQRFSHEDIEHFFHIYLLSVSLTWKLRVCLSLSSYEMYSSLMAMRAKSFQFKVMTAGAFWKYPPFLKYSFLPPLFLLSQDLVCFWMSHCLWKCAQFCCNNAFITQQASRQVLEDKAGREMGSESGLEVAENTWFLLISWDNFSEGLFQRSMFGDWIFLTSYFFFPRWYFNFLLYPGKDNGHSLPPQFQWNGVEIFKNITRKLKETKQNIRQRGRVADGVRGSNLWQPLTPAGLLGKHRNTNTLPAG